MERLHARFICVLGYSTMPLANDVHGGQQCIALLTQIESQYRMYILYWCTTKGQCELRVSYGESPPGLGLGTGTGEGTAGDGEGLLGGGSGEGEGPGLGDGEGDAGGGDGDGDGDADALGMLHCPVSSAPACREVPPGQR